MASKPFPRPWRDIVRLKDELRTGELSLAEFAADLHQVTLALGRRPVYEDPAKFFALTFPTPPLRELVQDVAARLAGQSDKAVRQLELTYGGGKTHTLITLYHLFRDPDVLPDLPAVREFRAGSVLPRAVPVSLCFDKIDVERGIDGVRGPNGDTRTLRHPWSVLAFQLAGDDGLRAIHGGGEAEERETPPAEPLLVALLERPQARGLSTLILVDEVLMYAREKAGADPIWRDRIVDFFQYLAQAVAKVDRAAMVASLLATDPKKQTRRDRPAVAGGTVRRLPATARRGRAARPQGGRGGSAAPAVLRARQSAEPGRAARPRHCRGATNRRARRDAAGISEAVRELAGVATSETTEGAKTDWATLLDAELQKARQIQTELLALATGREAEQAVIAVFLHSQPTGHGRERCAGAAEVVAARQPAQPAADAR